LKDRAADWKVLPRRLELAWGGLSAGKPKRKDLFLVRKNSKTVPPPAGKTAGRECTRSCGRKTEEPSKESGAGGLGVG